MAGTPPGDALLPLPKRATPARKGASCGTGAGSPRGHQPQPGHTGRGTLAARSRGRAAGRGTAPDSRRPSQRWQASSPRGRPPTTPLAQRPLEGMQAKGTVLGPHTHRPAPTARGWRTPTARRAGRQSGEGQRLTSDAPHNGGRHPPRGRPFATPTASNAGPQRRTLWDRCWVPTPAMTAPGTSGHGTPATRSSGRAAGGGTAPDTRRPSQRWQAPPPGTPFRHPHSEQRQPARAHAVGPVLGPHARMDRTRDTRVAEPWPPAPEDGRPGEGQRLTPGAPCNGGRPPPPGDGYPPPPRHAAPTGHADQGDSVGPPHPHTRAHSTWVADPNSPPSGRAVRGGTAPDLRRPAQWWKATPPGTPFRHPHSEQRRPARAHAGGPVLGPHTRTDRNRDTRVAEPWLPAPEDRRPGEGKRLTPDAPHNGGRPPPPGTAPHHARGTQPPQGMQARGTVLGPHTHTPAPTARGWRTPTARPIGGQSGEG